MSEINYLWAPPAPVSLPVRGTRARFPALRERLLALHPYDCPELVALPIEAGHEAYLRWLRDSTTV